MQPLWWMKMEPLHKVTFQTDISVDGKSPVLIDDIKLCGFTFEEQSEKVLCR